MRKLYNSISTLLSPQHLRSKVVGGNRTKATVAFWALSFFVLQFSFAQNYQTFDASTTNAWTASKWTVSSTTNACDAGAKASAFTAGRIAYFCTPSGTGSGSAGITIGGIIATESYTHSSGSGTLATGGTVVTIDVASGKVFNFGSGAVSAAAGTGFIKAGAGALSWSGAAWPGGFTINAGTIVAAGVNSMGGAAGNSLTINGGTIAGTGPRDFSGKFPAGITVGGNFTLGSGTAPAVTTANLTFSNNMALGTGTSRIITTGGSGNYTFGGVISGSGSNLEVTTTSSGPLIFTNAANTYNGDTKITSGELRLNPSANASFASQVVLNGGTLSTTGITATRTWTNSSTLKLDASSTIALGTGDHTLTFANSSAVTWAGSTLTITGWTGAAGSSGTGGKIVVGAGGLSGAQLAKISFTGFPGTPVILAGEVVPPGVSPSITPSPTSLTSLDYVFGSGPSAAQTFTLTAANLTAGPGTITIDATASPNYEVSTTSPGTSGYGATATLGYTGTGTISPNTVWVRLKSGLSVANYNSQTISISGGTGSASVTASGAVTPVPYMILGTINTAVTENMDVMGTAATTTTLTSLPSGFKVGTDWSTGTTANTVAGGTTGANTISAGGTYNYANGVNASSTDRGLGFLFSGGFSSPRSIVLKMKNNTGSTIRQLDISFDYEKYRNGQITLTNTFTHGATTTPSTAESAGTQVYTTDGNNNLVASPTTINKTFSLTGLSIANGTDYYFMWTFTGSASTNSIGVGIDNFSVTPRDQSLLTDVASLSGFNYTGAGPSAEQSFTISGDNLGSNVVLTPPTDYEISFTSGSGFVANPSTLSVTPVGGIITGQPKNVYVRLKAGLSGGLYNGENITLTSGVISKVVSLNGGVVPDVNLSATVNAGTEAGTTVVTLTATASSAVSGAQTVTVGVSGTGITTGDYSLAGAALSGSTLTIPNAGTSASFTFTVTNDLINEGTETATVTISSASAGIILGSTLTQAIVITDDDDAIYLNTLGASEPAVTFDDLANTGTTNSLTIKGAYLYETGSSANTTYAADNGATNSGNTYSYGTTAATDRALGSLASGNVAPTHFGLKVANNTGGNINAFEITYTGEQWRNGGNTSADILYFEYSTDATSLSTGTWNKINALNMVSLINTVTPAALNGNLPANQTTLNGVVGLGTISTGTSFWVRWRDENIGGSDHGMGVDDVILKPLFITPSIFYSKSSGDLDQIATWGDNTDGSGNLPPNFTTAGQIFYVANHKATAATIGANWTVSGSTAKVSIGNGLDTNSFVVPTGFTFSSPSLDVRSNNVFTNESPTTAAVFGTIDATSTVTYGAISGTQNVDATTYGYLNFVGAGTKNISGALTVQKDLTLDGATMDKLFAGFVNITYAGNITVLSPCTYLTGFTTNVSFVTSGNAVQVVKGNGNVLGCSQFNCLTKTAGSLTLSTTGGSTTISTQDDIKLNMPAGTSFVDGGNLLNVGGDFETDGLAGSYTLTGTLSMNGFPAAAVNIRLNATGGSALPGVAELNNVIINSATSNQVNFQPIGAGSGSTLIKGNLTISGASGYTTGIKFGNAAATGVTLQGNYNNTLPISVVFPTAGTLIFGGTSPQTYSTAYANGDSFFNVVLSNSTGLTLVSGDMQTNGNLNCSSGILNTGANKVIMGSSATITETTTSNVIGFVQATRTLTTALQTFGGLGLEITSPGIAPGVTTVSRETGTSLPIGCSSASNKRIFNVTAATNTGLNATVAYKYLGSVAELNGLNDNNFNLFDQSGNLISSNAVLNTGSKTITATGLTSLTSYVAAIPSPTLGGVTLTQAYTCDDSTNVVNLSGLLQSGTFNISYTINGAVQVPIAGLVANGSGNASFTTPVLFNGNNGHVLEITSISQPSSGCSQAFVSGNSATLDVRPRPTVQISANDFVCQFQNAPIDFSFTGNANWLCDYKINGVVQTQINTALALYPNDYINASVARTYAIARLRDANCPANLAGLDTFFINVPIPCSITWDGSASTDWNDGDNWTPNNGAPSNQTSVVILGGTPNQPVLNNNTPAAPVCASLTLVSNATPTIASGFQLTVRGNLTGSSLPSMGGNGKVILAGTGLQTVSGIVRLTNVDFANTSASGVVINSGSTLRIEPSGVVSFLANSKLTNNGDFVLGSNASGTAKIGLIPTTANILPAGAQFTQERYLPYTSGLGSWFFIGSPFSGKNFTDWVDDFRVTGLSSGFGSQGGDIISSVEPERNTIFKYVEATHDTRVDTVQKIGWTIPGSADQIVAGNGYRTFINYASNASHLFDSKGTLNRNDFVFPTMTRNELGACIPTSFPCDEISNRGWNLLANPYPCDIDWDAAAGWTKPGTMSNAWYRWHSTGNGYGVYTAGIYAGATPAPSNPNVIPSGQAYFVRLTNPGTYTASLTVKELAKTTSSAGQFLRVNTSSEQIRIHLAKANASDNYGYEAVIRFAESATDGVDQNFDFTNLGSNKFQVTVPVMGEEMAIASFAPVTDYKAIPLATDYKGVHGEYILSFTDLDNLIGNNQVFLKDHFLGQLVAITPGTAYSYTTSNDASGAADRFEILINPTVFTSVSSYMSGAQVSIHPNPSSAGTSAVLSIRGFDDASVNIAVTDALGRQVYTTKAALTSGNGTEVNLSKSLPAGVYTVTTRGARKSVTQKFVVK